MNDEQAIDAIFDPLVKPNPTDVAAARRSRRSNERLRAQRSLFDYHVDTISELKYSTSTPTD